MVDTLVGAADRGRNRRHVARHPHSRRGRRLLFGRRLGGHQLRWATAARRRSGPAHPAHVPSAGRTRAHHSSARGVQRARLGRRARLQPRAGRRLHGRRRRCGVLGAVRHPRLQPGLRLDVAVAAVGGPGTGEADAAARREGDGIGRRGLGPDPRRRRAVGPRRSRRATCLHSLPPAPTVAIGLAKQAIGYGQHATLPQAMNQELFNLELSCRTTDFKEGLAAFRERRTPEFNGR